MPRLPGSALARLVETAAEFARAQPALAGYLGASAAEDPAVERVREGLFFLGATVIEQVRRFEADGHRSLTEIVAQDLYRPFPAASIVEFTVSEAETVRIAAGSELHARGNPNCRFRVVGDVDVSAALIEGCRVEPEQRFSLRFDLATPGDTPLARAIGRSLRVYVDEPRETALGLIHHLLTHTTRVELRRADGETLPGLGLEPFGFDAAHSLAPEPEGMNAFASAIREYFLLPEKFLLFDVQGIGRALGDAPDRRATLIFRFDAPLPQQVRVSPSGLRAHCAPVANLFPTSAEPRLCTPAGASYALRVAGLPAREASIYAVVGVSAKRPGADASVRVPPARRFAAAPLADDFPYVYTTKQERAPGRREADMILFLTSPANRAPLLDPYVISAEILATNRELGASVKPGDLSEPGAGMSPGVKARNIVATSPYVPPPAGQDLVLRAMVRGQVACDEPLYTLKSLLYSLVPSAAFNDESARSLTARIDAIEALSVRTDRNAEGTRRGYLASFSIDEASFGGLGDVALYLRVLTHVLDRGASVNRFFRCEALCTKSGARFFWPPRVPS